MEALQKLKTLAFQCTAAPPCLSFRRRKTLRRFLKSPFPPRLLLLRRRRRRRHADFSKTNQADVEKKGLIDSHSLKDLFVKSPPSSPAVIDGGDGGAWRMIGLDGLGGSGRRGGFIGRRIGLTGLRYRFLRPAWRPKLVAIPELRTEDDELLL